MPEPERYRTYLQRTDDRLPPGHAWQGVSVRPEGRPSPCPSPVSSRWERGHFVSQTYIKDQQSGIPPGQGRLCKVLIFFNKFGFLWVTPL